MRTAELILKDARLAKAGYRERIARLSQEWLDAKHGTLPDFIQGADLEISLPSLNRWRSKHNITDRAVSATRSDSMKARAKRLTDNRVGTLDERQERFDSVPDQHKEDVAAVLGDLLIAQQAAATDGEEQGKLQAAATDGEEQGKLQAAAPGSPPHKPTKSRTARPTLLQRIWQALDGETSIRPSAEEAVVRVRQFKHKQRALATQVKNLRQLVASKDAQIAKLQDELDTLRNEQSMVKRLSDDAGKANGTASSEYTITNDGFVMHNGYVAGKLDSDNTTVMLKDRVVGKWANGEFTKSD